jgi:hypothetical protein
MKVNAMLLQKRVHFHPGLEAQQDWTSGANGGIQDTQELRRGHPRNGK